MFAFFFCCCSIINNLWLSERMQRIQFVVVCMAWDKWMSQALPGGITCSHLTSIEGAPDCQLTILIIAMHDRRFVSRQPSGWSDFCATHPEDIAGIRRLNIRWALSGWLVSVLKLTARSHCLAIIVMLQGRYRKRLKWSAWSRMCTTLLKTHDAELERRWRSKKMTEKEYFNDEHSRLPGSGARWVTA